MFYFFFYKICVLFYVKVFKTQKKKAWTNFITIHRFRNNPNNPVGKFYHNLTIHRVRNNPTCFVPKQAQNGDRDRGFEHTYVTQLHDDYQINPIIIDHL